MRTPVNHYTFRFDKVKKSLMRRGIDGFLVTDINNIRYLTSFSGSSAFLLITKKENIFVTDFRYKEQAEKEVRGWDIFIQRKGLIKGVKNLSRKIGIKNLGFESSVSYDLFRKLSRDLNLKDFTGFIEKFRETKDSNEIYALKEAIRRAEKAFLDVKPYIKQGTKEKTIAIRLEERLRKRGCRRIPFEIIVASGPNSSMPHARPTERQLLKGDLIIIDWCGEADGYCSDMTRTLLIKGGDNIGKKKEIYQLVLAANKKAISCIYPGIKSKDVDSSTRHIIKKAGYGDFFGHGTGHGIGLQVHESPRITWNGREVLKENMIITVEPGIYLPGSGGVRIEDMVLVTAGGSEVLTALPKDLEIIR